MPQRRQPPALAGKPPVENRRKVRFTPWRSEDVFFFGRSLKCKS